MKRLQVAFAVLSLMAVQTLSACGECKSKYADQSLTISAVDDETVGVPVNEKCSKKRK